MLRDAVTLDAAMSVKAALLRLAQHGYWLDYREPVVSGYLEGYASRIRTISAMPRLVLAGDDGYLDRPDGPSADRSWEPIDPSTMDVDGAARLLARPMDEGRVAVRRQEGVTIFWYAWPVRWVLERLQDNSPATKLRDALDLHERDSVPTMREAELGQAAEQYFPGVVLRGQEVVAVGEPELQAPPPRESTGTGSRAPDTGAIAPPPPPPPPPPPSPMAPAPGGGPVTDERVKISAFPRLGAPSVVQVAVPFEVVIGLGERVQEGVVSSGRMELSAPAGATTIPVTVQVVADGFHAPDGWSHELTVAVADPTANTVRIALVALPQEGPVRLTSIVVHYVADGVARGSVTRNLVVESSAGAAPPPDDRGQSWVGAGDPPPAMSLEPVTARPDVELDIARVSGDSTSGRYCCVIRNAHGIPVPDGSLEMDLGDDAKTFARQIIDQVRQWSGDQLVDNLLESVGAMVADKLPRTFWDTLRAVADVVTDRPMTFQLNSADPYVPWELALVDPPLDPARPRYLAAQLVMGRWILGDSSVASPPHSSVVVRSMAVMAGMYNLASGLRPLPEAQAEAQALSTTFAGLPAVLLDCTPADLKSLLDASLSYMTHPVGGAEAVHFAGHGEVDPSRPGEAALYLSNGKALTPLFFRRSRLGSEFAPFIFLNACMVGTAGEMLGDYGGFPGNCLAGGFSGLVAPLWAVNDSVARNFALDFYDQTLAGDSQKRSVAEVLRDLRANYRSEQPVSSYLAYVYYGNPFLTLSRASTG